MAFIYLRGDTWYIAFKTRKGLRRLSTYIKDEKEATRYLNNFIPQKEKPKHDLLLSEYQDEFIDNIRVDHEPGTLKLYGLTFRYLYKYISDKYLEDYSLKDFNKFRNSLTTHMKLRTANIHIRNTKCIFTSAWKLEYTKDCMTKNLKEFKYQKSKYLAFTEKQINQINDFMKPCVHKDIFLFGIQTGCRLNEILNLKFKDIDTRQGLIFILDPKTKDFRELPLTDELQLLITKRMTANNVIDFDCKDKYIFPNQSGNKFDKSKVSKIFKAVLRKLRFNEDYHFHCLRHTFASDLANRGVPMNQIAYLMGHKNYETTKQYIHTGYDELKKSMELRTLKSV
jgi:integrase